MALVRQPKTAGFRPISRYDTFVDQQSRCELCGATPLRNNYIAGFNTTLIISNKKI